MSAIFTPFVFQSAVQAITPILLASLAGVLCGRVGVFNLALEGQMLVGAFAAIVGSYFTHSALGGVAAAMAGAVAFSLVLAYGATVFRGDPVVIGIGMNLLASGLTAYLLRGTFGVSGTFSDPGIVGLGRIAIPPLIGVPVLGWAFGRQSALTWVAWALTAVVSVVLFKTPVGLRLRGVGEQPDAAETLGVDIVRYRVVTVLVAGALAGLAGAQLSLGAVSVFSEDMSAGRGWIAGKGFRRMTPTITPGKVALVGGLLRDKLYEGPPEFRQAYARLLMAEVRVTEEEIRISGPKSVLAKYAADGVCEPAPKVLSFVQEWRARRDSNS